MLIVAHCRPSFCYTQQSMECEGFVSAVENELLQSSVSVEAMAGRKAQDAVVFVFDRRCDPVTPLLNQWTLMMREMSRRLIVPCVSTTKLDESHARGTGADPGCRAIGATAFGLSTTM